MTFVNEIISVAIYQFLKSIIIQLSQYIRTVFEISVGPTVRDREVVCRTDNKLNLPVLLSDNISDRVFTNL